MWIPHSVRFRPSGHKLALQVANRGHWSGLTLAAAPGNVLSRARHVFQLHWLTRNGRRALKERGSCRRPEHDVNTHNLFDMLHGLTIFAPPVRRDMRHADVRGALPSKVEQSRTADKS